MATDARPVRLASGALLALATGCTGPAPGPAGPPAVVVVLVDGLRPDHIGAFGAAPSPTPALDRCLADATRFSVARAPSSAAVPAVHALLAADHPGAVAPGAHLAHRVAAAGVEGRLLASTLFLTGAFGMGEGWTETAHHEGAPAADQVDRALDRLAHRAAPQLVVVELSDLLLPTPLAGAPSPRLDAAPPALALWAQLEAAPLTADEAAHLRQAYDHHLAAVDTALGRLCGALGPDDTLVLTAPHGQALGEQGAVGHGFGLSEVQLRVPLALRGPGLAAGPQATPVDLADLGQTLGLLVGAPAAAGTGRDLRAAGGPSWRARPLLLGPTTHGPAQVGLVDGDQKWIAGPGAVQALDLAADPAEQAPTTTDDWPGALRRRWHAAASAPTVRVLRVQLQPGGPTAEPLTLHGPTGLRIDHPAGVVDLWAPPSPIHSARWRLAARPDGVELTATSGRLPRELYVQLANPTDLDGLALAVVEGDQTWTARWPTGAPPAGDGALRVDGPAGGPVTARLAWVPARGTPP